MSEQQPEERDPAPKPNPISGEPATVEACQQDYADADDVRRRLGWKDSD
ncbi:hypothetical protein L0F81_23850 [Streptomyces tricolor]|uniref:Uncharacterized protein n=1 Tax=Streptomyces tricolor TaxID=68277 RepID=A0ABS9JL39_9ACTN|nr:hypothetical protein [Streptomyces tricolor]MCG0066287.1 hypothetical protein [Streptomyces tricolor]